MLICFVMEGIQQVALEIKNKRIYRQTDRK